MNHQVSFFGSKNDDNKTPDDFYQELHKEFDFNFDPCPLQNDITKFDGLKEEWKERNYCNPPYSEIEKWIDKGLEELKKGKMTVFLITARTNTKYWKDKIFPRASEIRLMTSKLAFGEHTRKFPIALSVVVFKPNSKKKRTLVNKNTYSYYKM